MDQSKYSLIPNGTSDFGDGDVHHKQRSRYNKRLSKGNSILIVALLGSIFLNAYFLWQISDQVSIGPTSRSLYGKPKSTLSSHRQFR